MELSSWVEQIDLTLLTSYAISVIGVLVLLLVAWVVAGWVRRSTHRSLERAGLDLTLTRFFANFARYTVLTVAVIACLGVFGVDTTSFAAVLAAAGFAVGLAFQNTLSNFSAGIMLLVFRPFKAGDMVEVADVRGRVREIELFTTLVDTPDNRRMTIPNSEVFGNVIENETHHETRRVEVLVDTDYAADLAEARRVLEEVAVRQHQEIEDREPQVYLDELGASSISWKVRVWCRTDDRLAVREQLTEGVKNALDAAGIGIPYPQMDVHLDGVLDRDPSE